MDKGEKNNASEEKAHILMENGKSSTEKYLPEQKKKEKEAEYEIKNIQWHPCDSFTVQRGWQQIEEYISVSDNSIHSGKSCLLTVEEHEKLKESISVPFFSVALKSPLLDRGDLSATFVQQTWEIHESWLHWSEFLQEEELKYSKRYHYRACFSIPTRRKPIPRATASVYFVIEISKIKPATLPVEVFFTLESSRLIHRPGQCRFREKWLKDIIENKIILMERLTSH